jgi:hypothetical protein
MISKLGRGPWVGGRQDLQEARDSVPPHQSESLPHPTVRPVGADEYLGLISPQVCFDPNSARIISEIYQLFALVQIRAALACRVRQRGIELFTSDHSEEIPPAKCKSQILKHETDCMNRVAGHVRLDSQFGEQGIRMSGNTPAAKLVTREFAFLQQQRSPRKGRRQIRYLNRRRRTRGAGADDDNVVLVQGKRAPALTLTR